MSRHAHSSRPLPADDAHEAENAGAAKPRSEWSAVWRLLPYLRAFHRRVTVAMLLLLAAKLANVTLPYMLKLIVDSLDPDDPALLVLPLALLLGYGALRFATIAFGELRDLVFGRVTENAMREVALGVFRHLHRLDLDFHLTRRTGGLSRDIERGVGGIRFLLRFLLFNIIPTLLEIGMVAAILLFAFGAEFALIIFVAVFLYIVFSIVVTEWRTAQVRLMNRLDSRANTRAVDSLLNYETVKYFGNEEFEASEYDRNLAAWQSAMMRNRVSLATLNGGQAMIIAVAVTTMMILAAQRVVAGQMTIGDLVMVNAYMIQLFVPLNFLGFVYREIKQSLADMARMFSLLDRHTGITDAPDAVELGTGPMSVDFEQVEFGYRPDRPILRGVSFHVPAGHSVAVVGASGAGKSTIARLLFRSYDTTGGAVLVDGQDLRTLTQDSLRANIGVVPQDTVLFNETILYNIAYGRPGADQAEIDAAAATAHLTDFIASLPDGYETMVGERGLKLSGGEKQRIAIARAVLKDPGIMIFDEATSSLDSASEQAILQALREVARERTSLIIAHRLSTIVDVHEIIVLEAGRIVERGDHATLLAHGGAYHRLWQMQRRAELDDSRQIPDPVGGTAQ